MEDTSGWSVARLAYETNTMTNGQQTEKLAERLRMKRIPHLANVMAPALPGYVAPGVRADIVLEGLQLIIEVEGPQRMCIPLRRVIDEMDVDDIDIYGRYEDVIGKVQRSVECNLSGPCFFKRRILQRCGWRVVTLTFDENEEYIADALTQMQKDRLQVEAEGKEEETAGDDAEEAVDAEMDVEGADSTSLRGGQDAVEDEAVDELEAPAETQAATGFEGATSDPCGQFSSDNDGTADPQIDLTVDTELSEYENKLRKAHAQAMKELKRRVLEERGNAAGSDQYLDNVEFRDWQVALERDVFKEMRESVMA